MFQNLNTIAIFLLPAKERSLATTILNADFVWYERQYDHDKFRKKHLSNSNFSNQ